MESRLPVLTATHTHGMHTLTHTHRGLLFVCSPISSSAATHQPLKLEALSRRGFSQLPIWALAERPSSHSLLVDASVHRPLGRPAQSPPEALSIWGPSQVLLDGNDRNSSRLHREPWRWSVASCSMLVTASSTVSAWPSGASLADPPSVILECGLAFCVNHSREIT